MRSGVRPVIKLFIIERTGRTPELLLCSLGIMAVNPRSLANLLPMTRLDEGMKSDAHRTRAEAEALAWWAAKTPEERGRIVEKAYRGTSAGRAALEADHDRMRREWLTGKYFHQSDLCREFGWSKSAVSRALKGIPHPRATKTR